jgi:hypothetical protein
VRRSANANCRCGSAKCYAFGAPDCIRKSLRPEMSRHTMQFSTRTMRVHQYHGDTDETPTVDASNLSVPWMVGPAAVSVVLAGTRCLASFPFSLRHRRLHSGRSSSACRATCADIARPDANCLRNRLNNGSPSGTKRPEASTFNRALTKRGHGQQLKQLTGQRAADGRSGARKPENSTLESFWRTSNRMTLRSREIC